jgi:hypothetical protein
MPCPFFAPAQRLDAGPWTNPPRLPLGDAYSGFCRVRSGEVHAPPEEHQREICNCGYARGRCDRFPEGDSADAVRFSVSADRRAGKLRLVYILEREHAPASHGAIEFKVKKGALLDSPGDGVLAAQGRAFAESYLRKSNA